MNEVLYSNIQKQLSRKMVSRKSKWINPTKKQKVETEFPPHHPVSFGHSFTKMKKQVGKKNISNKSKKERIAQKSVSLSERLQYTLT